MKYCQNWNETKTNMSSKQTKNNCHQNWNITKTEMSPKLKFHQRWIVTKARISSKLKCHWNWNVTKTCYSLVELTHGYTTNIKARHKIIQILMIYLVYAEYLFDHGKSLHSLNKWLVRDWAWLLPLLHARHSVVLQDLIFKTEQR